MLFYAVSGTFEYNDLYFCECEHCNGHGSDKIVTARVDCVIKAINEESAIRGAIDKAVACALLIYEGSLKWTDGPHVAIAATDVTNRLIGAKTLPGLEG